MKKAVLEITEPAVNESGGPARGAACEVVLLHERDAQTTQRGIAGNTTSGNSTTDDEEIELVACERDDLLTALFDWRIVARSGGCQIVFSGIDGCVACDSSRKLIRIIGHMTSSSFDSGESRAPIVL